MHLAAGLVAGVVILIMSVTGVLLAFERQIVEWAERDYRFLPQSGERQSIENLLAGLPAQGVTGITLRSDPAAATVVNFGRERVLFVHPSTGAVLGEGAKRVRGFFHIVTDLHRWLGAHGENRAVGRAVTGACNTAFVVLVVSGIYLWWPRQWSRRALAGITWFKGGLSGRARDWNWHNTIGFWSAPVLVLITLTGMLISYPWATSLLYRMTGNEPPPPRTEQRAGSGSGPSGAGQETGGGGNIGQGERRGGGSGEGRGPRGGDRSAQGNVSWTGIDRLFEKAQTQVAGWETISVRAGNPPTAPVVFTIDRGHRGRPDLRGQLTLDRKSGEVVKWEPFSSFNLGRQLRTWARWVHTGEAGGVLGQIIAAIASAGGAVLVWTGFALSWRRFFGRRICERKTMIAGDRTPEAEVVAVPE